MRGRRNGLVGLAVVVCALALGGCRQEVAPPPTEYEGEIDSLQDVILQIDANNRQIPTLWAHQQFDGLIHDDKGAPHVVSAYSGVLLYRGPSEMMLRASNEFGPVFELGIDETNYWMQVNPELDTLWWGRVANIGKPGGRPIPIQPQLLLQVLALNTIDPMLLHSPYPIMRFNNTADCYMIDFAVKEPDQLVVAKEVWYDREKLNPTLVLLYGADGRKLMSARLSKFVGVPIDGEPSERWPTVATNFDLYFYGTHNTMQFRLSDVGLTDKKTHTVPHAGSIHMPDLDTVDVKNVKQLDAGL